jgi:hypothetical protein
VRYRCVEFAPVHAERWDELVAASANGTFLHTRRFLSYHGERFLDRSVVVLDEKKHAVAAFPAALDPAAGAAIVSHPGITYGGLVMSRQMRGEAVLAVFDALLEHYRAAGAHVLRYKAVPAMYHRWPAQDDLYALFRHGARLYRRDLSAAADLSRPQPWSERRRRAARRARDAGLNVVEGREQLVRFWPVLTQVLEARHHVQPVHTLADMQLLAGRFPDQIRFVGAQRQDRLLAGVVLFVSDRVCHAQYSVASDAGTEAGALDLVFEAAIEKARTLQRSWFDFGVSTEQQGGVLNGGLHEFKAGFGAGAMVYDFYEVALASSSLPPA